MISVEFVGVGAISGFVGTDSVKPNGLYRRCDRCSQLEAIGALVLEGISALTGKCRRAVEPNSQLAAPPMTAE